MRLRAALAATAAVAAGAALAAGAAVQAQQVAPRRAADTTAPGIHLIKHVIIITQENRSFDDYFGTFPGADGIPKGVCLPDPRNGGSDKPYVNHADSVRDDPHGNGAMPVDVDRGKMNGFVREAEHKLCVRTTIPCRPNVMGYHVGTDIPNYWDYARHFVLLDHYFDASDSWSLPSHLYLVSGWAARCAKAHDVKSCVGGPPVERSPEDPEPFEWTDITYLLHKSQVSWSYYLDHGAISPSNPQGVSIHWNVLPGFPDVHADKQLPSIRPLTVFTKQAKAGTLPHVSWVEPNFADSEHPPALTSRGEAFVTRVINAVMRSPDWKSSVIFLSWDDWGGFYDNIRPPRVDREGYGIRVPGIIISPYARHHFIDHDVLSSDAILQFIEDDFLNGARLNPKTDGRPDPRPDVRENSPVLGNILNAFDFTQKPLAPLVLSPCPAHSTLQPRPAVGCDGRVPLHVNRWGDT